MRGGVITDSLQGRPVSDPSREAGATGDARDRLEGRSDRRLGPAGLFQRLILWARRVEPCVDDSKTGAARAERPGGNLNLYEATADYYDFDTDCVAAFENFRDIPFFLDQARLARGPVLEIGCGTGRVTIPVAAAGFEIHGIDLSDAMLKRCREKLARLDPAIRSRISIEKQDMRDFRVDRRFDLVIVPFNTFQGLLTEADALSCLSSIESHLTTTGRLILTLSSPEHLAGAAIHHVTGEETLWETDDSSTAEEKLSARIANRVVDWDGGIQYFELRIYRTLGEGPTTRVSDSFALRYYTESRIRSLLASCGFEILEAYGDYAGSPIGEGHDFVLICARG